MYCMYLDDSGSEKNPGEDYVVLGGFSVFERQIHWISREMDKLAESIHPADPSSIEFHASEIFSGRTPPWNGMSKEDRRGVIVKALKVLAESHDSTRAFACAVHKKSFPSRNSMELAFEEMCNRFDLHLGRLYHQGDNQRGMIILDKCSDETSLQILSREFRTQGTRWRNLKNMVEVPLFVDSRSSRLVQLADHVAYAVFRRYQAGDTNYLDIILPKFDSESGKLHGLVHKQNSASPCLCPACMSRTLTPGT